MWFDLRYIDLVNMFILLAWKIKDGGRALIEPFQKHYFYAQKF